jgi:hypothetical protein
MDVILIILSAGRVSGGPLRNNSGFDQREGGTDEHPQVRFVLVHWDRGWVVVGRWRGQGGLVTSGLVLQLESDTGVTTDGTGHVTGWADQSGNGHDATAGNGPLLVSNVLNGLPVLRFDGSSTFLNLTGQVLTSQQFTIFAVVNDTASLNQGSPTFREIISNWDTSNSVGSVFLGTDSYSNNDHARLSDDLGGAANGQLGAGTLSSPADHFIFTGVSGSTDAAIYQGGTLLADKGSPLSSRNLTTGYTIGRQGTLGGEYWNGDIAAILVYNRELSASERSQVWGYLNQKYFGITSVPEPSTLVSCVLAAATLSGFHAVRRRRRSG